MTTANKNKRFVKSDFGLWLIQAVDNFATYEQHTKLMSSTGIHGDSSNHYKVKGYLVTTSLSNADLRKLGIKTSSTIHWIGYFL